MRREPHPISGAIYRELGDGTVAVEDRKSGKQGKFRWDGTWLDGDLTHADPHFLIFVGGPTMAGAPATTEPPDHEVAPDSAQAYGGGRTDYAVIAGIAAI